MKINNWTYSTNNDNTARFTLGKIGNRMLFFIGINPSTATPENLDRTVTRVERFVADNGYHGWVMLNVYAQRATDPNNMHTELNINLHKQNIEHIKELVKTHANFEICAGWGTEINRRPYLKNCLKDIANTIGINKRWVHLHHLTKNNHPRHPLYLPANAIINDFDINNYILK
jgi:hypothetical protein